jgi:hypothetical protein
MVAGGTIAMIVIASACGMSETLDEQEEELAELAASELYDSSGDPGDDIADPSPLDGKHLSEEAPGDLGDLDRVPFSADATEPADMTDELGHGVTSAAAPSIPTPSTFVIRLTPDGVSGRQRINFAIPFAPGVLTDPTRLRFTTAGIERPAARRVLARHSNGSARSVQIQLDLDVTTYKDLTVQLGVAGQTGPSLVAVSTTLTGSGTNVRPRVAATLPATVLVASGLGGPMLPASSVAGTTLDTWTTKCNYTKFSTDAFVSLRSSKDVWLYDRVTALYRGYMLTGSITPLRYAYREATIYRSGMTISGGVATNIPVPNASSDLKYYYAQGLALHYLLTGDDRFREAAEAVSARAAALWKPTYTGAFWTERHAGFALLAHEWAARVTDDQAATINSRANAAVTAFLSHQNAPVSGYSDTTARCFAHTATSHGESYGYTGCSPWMSAILADALDAHAQRVGGTRASEIRVALGRLGRILARRGRDGAGRPYYWMGVGTTKNQADPYEEHWGEAAYIVALAWDATGRTDSTLRTAAEQLVAGFRARGTMPHMRSFNWQCRSAVMTPALLK